MTFFLSFLKDQNMINVVLKGYKWVSVWDNQVQLRALIWFVLR